MPAEQRRAQLLDAALHLVVHQGLAAVSMESIAEQAGVTKPVVYGMFANRGELLAALLQREQEQGLLQVLDGFPDLSGADALTGFLERYLRAVQEKPDRWRCIVLPMPGMPKEFEAARDDARDLVLARAKDLAAGLLEGFGKPPGMDAEILAHTMVTLCEMAARLVLTDPAHFSPDRFTAAFRATLGLVR
ncbi:TetR/AcrR family transcriptional regulator [Pseudonocardiaceae bacterium YIM PH 21723]|nr:TetR/AcrR family transcriptional regulator [Pseudonocardiaceae bacterium YIM PH 21723]